MGTIKRLNDQQKQQAQAEAAMPGAYENRYDEGIQNALAGMDSANSAGLGFDSQNGTYRGALSRLFGNAGAGASAAEQVANSLSGGYGTDWAKSAAQQAAAGETGQTANVYAQARADALSQWQQELAGRGTQLDNLQGVSDLTVQQNAALLEGFNMLQQGAPEEMITQYLQPYGLSYDVLKNWSGLSQTDKDNLDYLIKAGDITASGNDKLGQTIAKAVGYGTDSMDDYSTIANRVNQSNLNYLGGQLALQNRYKTTGRSGGTGRSTGSGNSGLNYSSSNVTSLLKEAAGMETSNPMYSVIMNELQRAGVDVNSALGTGSGSGTAARSGSTGSKLAGVLQRPAVFGTVKPVDGTNGNSFDTALDKAQSMTNQGKSADEISEYLIRLGFGDDVISRVSNVMGW